MNTAQAAAACPVCRSTDRRDVAIEFTFVRHLDFLPTRVQPRSLSKCNACQMIYLADAEALADLKSAYRGVDYPEHKKTQHLVFSGSARPMRTTYAVLAELISAHLPADRQTKLLDVGCFDGKLLFALEDLRPDLTLHGFDVSPYHGERFAGSRITFSTGRLSGIEDHFDVISLVNALVYVDDVGELMASIDNLLSPDGLLFVVSTNAERNPCFLLNGDQCLFTTPRNLHNFLANFGFESDLVVDNPAFPRSIIAIARRRMGPAQTYQADDTLASAVVYLQQAAATLTEVVKHECARTPPPRISVLGCTNNAAWAYDVLGHGVDFFVDENPYRASGTFCGRAVKHPVDLHERDLLLVPYGATSGAMTTKFSRLYKARLFAV